MTRYGRGSRGHGGFTLVELLVVIAIIGILMGLSVNGLQRLMAAGRKATCISNLKQLHMAAMNFSQDHGGRLPYAASELWTQMEEGEEGFIETGSGTRKGWVGWWTDPATGEPDYRTYWWGDKGLACISNGTMFAYLGAAGSEGVYVCPEHARLARREQLVDCSGKKLSGLAGTKKSVQAVRSYGMNNRLSHAKVTTFKGASRTMLFAEQAFESQHPSGFMKGYGLRYVSTTSEATDEWIDPPLEDREGTFSQRFFRSWDGSIDLGSTAANKVESVGEMHSRSFKRKDGSLSRQGVVVFLDGHTETIDILDTHRVGTGDWGDD